MSQLLEDKIYSSIIGYCENIQQRGCYNGNGHHLAQKLSTLVAIALLSKQQKLIYQALSNSFKSVAEISKENKITSKQVSAQLISIYKKTALIYFKKEGKNKLWYRYDNSYTNSINKSF